MFSVSITYLGTAMAGRLVKGSSEHMASVYNILAGMNTTTNPEDLVIELRYSKSSKKVLQNNLC